MSTWFNASSVTVNNGSDIVTVLSGDNVAHINAGDALVIGSFSPVEIDSAYSTPSGVFIKLVKAWSNTTQPSQPAVVIPTAGDFGRATQNLEHANQIVHDNYQAMVDWQTKTGTVTFKDLDGNTHSVKTLKQRMSELEQIHPYPWAMRKVEFEARRQQNLDKYEASGFVHFGLSYSAGDNGIPINDGLWARINEDNKNQLRTGNSFGSSSPFGKSKKESAVLNIYGVLTSLESLSNSSYVGFIKFPAAEDGTRTYDSATGLSVSHANADLAFLAETATNKVVTDRQDGYGFLLIKQEINDEYPFVYAHGLPQSHASHINGVPTVVNNIQPIEYFAQFDGDTTSRGRGVNWQTASDERRAIIASDPANKIEFDDVTGKFYQTHVFVLSWAGAGNGDWQNIDAITGDLQFDAFNKIAPAITNASKFTAGKYKGVFTADNNPDCHIYFCGTVNRLNRGAYHPCNPFGSNLIQDNAGNTTAGRTWSEARAKVITSKKDAFLLSGSESGLSWGDISSGFSGRPDGRYHDAIYASGAGGVCRDMRYSAHGLSLEDFAEQDLKVKSGEYRGVEKLYKTVFLEANGQHFPSSIATNSIYIDYTENGGIPAQLEFLSFSNGNLPTATRCRGSVITNQGVFKIVAASKNTISARVYLYLEKNNQEIPEQGGVKFSIEKELNLSLSGLYTHIDVIGDPLNLLLCDDLKNGWIGSWIPDLSTLRKQLTKPVHNSVNENSISIIFSADNGASWTSGAQGYASVTNTIDDWNPDNIAIVSYKTKAKATIPTVNSEIWGGYKGLGDVFCCSFYASSSDYDWGRGLANSLTDNILVNNNSAGSLYSTLALKDVQLRPDSQKLEHTVFRAITHEPISMLAGAPINGIDRKGLKALSYYTEQNGQAYICYAYAELHYDSSAGNWGDDAQVHIVDGQSTIIDLNGHIVKVGTAIIVEPLGWVKNAA